MRADEGLALSSRKGYLDASQRLEAVALSRELMGVGIEVRRGRRDWSAMDEAAMQSVAARVAARLRGDSPARGPRGKPMTIGWLHWRPPSSARRG